MYNFVELNRHLYMAKKVKLLRISEVAEILGVNPETLRRWDNSGLLKAIRLGARRDRRYEKDEVLRIIEKSRK